MKKNNSFNDSRSSIEKMLFLLPKSCNCHTCIETKSYIRNEMGETRFVTAAKEAGISI